MYCTCMVKDVGIKIINFLLLIYLVWQMWRVKNDNLYDSFIRFVKIDKCKNILYNGLKTLPVCDILGIRQYFDVIKYLFYLTIYFR